MLGRMDGWKDGRWVDRQETLVTHYDRGESHYMIRMAFFLRVPDMSITQLNPLSDGEGPLLTFASMCERDLSADKEDGLATFHLLQKLSAFSGS